MDILQAARQLRPGTAWTQVTDFNKDGSVKSQQLIQADDGTPRVAVPTAAELKAVIDAAAYVDQRAAAYPAVGDQLDAIWKALAAVPNLPADATTMLGQIQAVKAKFPKPSA